MTDTSPVEAIQREIERVTHLLSISTGMPDHVDEECDCLIVSSLRRYLTSLELAKADAAMEALYEIHPIDDTWYAEEKRLSNHLQDMREKLCEVLR